MGLMRAVLDAGLFAPWVKSKGVEAIMTSADYGAYETCVLCRRVTDVRASEPIGERHYHMDGAGQLCPECYKSILS